MTATLAASATTPPRSARWTDVTARGALGDVAAVMAAPDADPRDGVVRRLSRIGEVAADGGHGEHSASCSDERAVVAARRACVQDAHAGDLRGGIQPGDLVAGARRGWVALAGDDDRDRAAAGPA